MSDDKTKCEKVIDEPTAEALGQTIAAVTTTSTTTAVVSATTISASSSASAWVMVNQYQLLLTTPTLETGLPDQLLAFMEEFEFFTFNFNIFKGWKFWEMEGVIGNFDFEQTVNGLNTIGYESGSIIVNEYQFGKLMAIIFLINGSLVLAYFILRRYKETKWMKLATEHIGKFFMYTLYIRIIIEAFFFIFINALSEVVNNADDIKNAFSYSIAIIAVIICLLMPCLLLWHYLRYRNKCNLAEDGRLTELYDGFKPKAICQLYNFIF